MEEKWATIDQVPTHSLHSSTFQKPLWALITCFLMFPPLGQLTSSHRTCDEQRPSVLELFCVPEISSRCSWLEEPKREQVMVTCPARRVALPQVSCCKERQRKHNLEAVPADERSPQSMWRWLRSLAQSQRTWKPCSEKTLNQSRAEPGDEELPEIRNWTGSCAHQPSLLLRVWK